MNIDIDILKSYGASIRNYKKGEYIFREGDPARYFYQVIDGQVKTSCSNEDGKTFTFMIFKHGDSFGEPSVFLNKTYPFNAIADTDCIVLSLNKDAFIKFINDHPTFQMQLLYVFANRLYHKTLTSKLIISENPEKRIHDFLIKYKKENSPDEDPVLIRYTRQEIADFTGLRVETIIRTIRKMHKENKLTIKDRKVYF